MSRKSSSGGKRSRRQFTQDFKDEAVRMLLEGHSASSVCERPGISSTNTLYRWKKECPGRESTVAVNREQRVRELQADLKRVQRERDILKKR